MAESSNQTNSGNYPKDEDEKVELLHPRRKQIQEKEIEDIDLDQLDLSINRSRLFGVVDSHKERFPYKSGLLAFFLLTIGTIFTISAFVILYRWGVGESIPFFVIAFISFVPGSFHSHILIRAWLGHKGYSYSQVPSFDD